MAGALRKTMVYLGLAEDEGRYDVDEYADDDLSDRHDHHRDAEVTHLPHRGIAEVVRSQPASGVSRITTIHPRTYNEAKTIGEHFRDGIPVIMNLSDMDDADAKRLVDFAAGLVFGLHGAIERVTAKVFLLSPSTVEVGVEEPGVPPARGLFNQN
ncbi:MAG TPA: cell division protein SepF [Dermatophilaceae bacterium]|nr:cell division protein SepF [Dermatophilaceae bacterium]